MTELPTFPVGFCMSIALTAAPNAARVLSRRIASSPALLAGWRTRSAPHTNRPWATGPAALRRTSGASVRMSALSPSPGGVAADGDAAVGTGGSATSEPETDSASADFDQRLGALPIDAARSGGGASRVPVSVSCVVNGRTLTFESGRVARQAHGAVTMRDGDTVVYSFAAADKDPSPDSDFMPLRIDYFERYSSVGRTAGSYLKREARPSDREVLVSRLIDRPLRPMFQNGYYNEVQLISYVFAYDGVHPSDWMGICASSAALHVSHIPLTKAVAGVRITQGADGTFIVNPTKEQLNESRTDMMVAGTANAILMIEGSCDDLTEEQVIEAVGIAQDAIATICGAMDELREKVGKEKKHPPLRCVSQELVDSVEELAVGLEEAVRVLGKKNREEAVDEVKDRVFAQLSPSREMQLQDPREAALLEVYLKMAWKKVVSSQMRRLILDLNMRPDGRDNKTVRPIDIDNGILPTTHGSSLFTRGETQTLAIATLGGNENAQRFETVDEPSGAKRFFLHYNFPPFSVGEVGRVGAPGRREIGHGYLAERSLSAVLPDQEDFPYVIRIESNILESNGSSSMATVCGGCLAMLNAGVPLKSPVAGIAMGLILDSETGKYAILTDLMGLEDALGDMDFKVGGTKTGITALQMDIKVEGINKDIMRDALEQARDGRLHVLREMEGSIPEGPISLPANIPKVRVFTIPIASVGEIIGRGGESIKGIVEECGGEKNITINVGSEGQISISSKDEELITKARDIISSRAVRPETGARYTGTVTKILPFGCYIEIMPRKEAWLHISEAELVRTEKMEDVVQEGSQIEVEVTELGKGGEVKVSRKSILLEKLGVKLGNRLTGKVNKVLPFGANIDLGASVEGWLHVSEANIERGRSMEDFCKIGDELEVEVVEIGRKLRVSRKGL